MAESENPESAPAPEPPPEPPQQDVAEPVKGLALWKTGALAPLLLLTLLTLITVLGFVEHQEPFLPTEGVLAAVPHSPAEFPEIFGKDESLSGLDGGFGDGGLLVAVAGPPFTRNIFPCMDCHGEADLPPNPERRELVDKHTNIKLVGHDEEHRWCLDCHDRDDRDVLHLAGGEKVPFTESYRLCGQCHGPQLKDWKVGIHGKRTGYWNGPKRYLLCVNCHNPHSPRFAPLKPLPPPSRPEFLRAADRPTAAAAPKKEPSNGN